MSREFHGAMTYLRKAGLSRVVVGLVLNDHHGNVEYFPQVLGAFTLDGKRGYAPAKLADLVWDAARVELHNPDGYPVTLASPGGLSLCTWNECPVCHGGCPAPFDPCATCNGHGHVLQILAGANR